MFSGCLLETCEFSVCLFVSGFVFVFSNETQNQREREGRWERTERKRKGNYNLDILYEKKSIFNKGKKKG